MPDDRKPPTKPTKPTDTPEFRAWFGDSKAVDRHGEPLVVYHGTSAEFSVFDTKSSEDGSFFTTNREAAEDYGDRVIAVYLNIRQPVEVTAMAWAEGHVPSRQEAEFNGHDGFVIRDHDISGAEGEDTIHSAVGDTWIAFRPEQIKSARINSGLFDANNPDYCDVALNEKAPVLMPMISDRHEVRVGPSVIHYEVNGEKVGVIDLETDPEGRGKGAARALMREFLQAADRVGKTVELLAYGQDETVDDKRLEGFYASLSFKALRADPIGGVVMERKPVQLDMFADVADRIDSAQAARGFLATAILQANQVGRVSLAP